MAHSGNPPAGGVSPVSPTPGTNGELEDTDAVAEVLGDGDGDALDDGDADADDGDALDDSGGVEGGAEDDVAQSGSIVIDSGAAAVNGGSLTSVTLRLNLYVPAFVGIPVIAPSAASCRPGEGCRMLPTR